MRLRPFSLAAVLLVACGGPDGPIEPTYENVAAVITRSCGSSSPSCHGGTGRGGARLNFRTAMEDGLPFTDVLVDVEACQYDLMSRVTPGDPDASWLMIKLAHDFDADGNIAFTPDPAWDPMLATNADGSLRASICPLVSMGELTFGAIMPQNISRPAPLSEAEVTLFREWILIGAPGPI